MTAPRHPRQRTQGAGRPAIEATPEDIEKIETMAGYGLTQNMMAEILQWSPDTFTRRKQDDSRILRALESGQAKAALRVGEALFKRATGEIVIVREADGSERRLYRKAPETAAIRWFEMTRLGRSARVREVEDEEDYPTNPEIMNMTTDQKISGMKELLAKYGRAANGTNGRNGKSRPRRPRR